MPRAALSAEINMFCSKDVKVIDIDDENEKEYLLPTHFIYKIENGKIEVKEVEVGTD